MRNRAGITERSPTGTDEVVYSNVTKTDSGRGCGLGRGGYRPGDMLASSPGTSGIMTNSAEQKNLEIHIKSEDVPFPHKDIAGDPGQPP
jgi:hypothetical protein